MNKIKLNNTEFEVSSYVKNSAFNGETVVTNASCTITTDDNAALDALVGTTITSIQIYCDDTLIYNLQNIEAIVENVNEWLSMDHMEINISFNFSNSNT